ncbi:glycoside hydrolase family 16 protein [Pseudonocardia broussonetiae]|uniref:Glycoside hydrolase family 16 protein n=1 Tax=Pseudonocardia broussonetiae TaxID=2736640 RepID=A0A6M6JFS0_9PSEU|nr:glycoside hydrolase family 16 protein [Pseudonocardia broussonetiae]QJY45239.1 glycoside hydrolase family 16 protein [Pseudonocardia broussonetiae]
MDLDEIEDLIRRYLSAGIAVVLILVAPGGGGGTAPPADPAVVTVTPSGAAPGTLAPLPTDEDAETAPRTTPSRTPAPTTADRSPAPRTTAPSTTAPSTTTRTTTSRTTTPAPRATPTDEETADEDTPDEETPDEDAPGEDRAGATAGSATAGSATPDGTTADTAIDPLGWGTPSREDDFTAGLAQWDLYEGTGHAGRGVRSPMNATVQDGILTLTGDAAGTTAGMCWGRGQRYGRWEGRIRAPQSDPSYDAVLLLWPDDDAPGGGEIDIAEMQDPARRTTGFHLHHGADDAQVEGRVEVDATEWHAWAVEWTPREITAYVDGRPWFRTTDAETFPPGPMHLCVQLDWFPSGDAPVRESTMQVDRVREWEHAPDAGAGDEPR